MLERTHISQKAYSLPYIYYIHTLITNEFDIPLQENFNSYDITF